MKFFGWMQNKLNGKQQSNTKPNTTTPPPVSSHMKQEPREEFRDWPNGLLAIGTFGNTSDHHHHQKQSSSSSDHDHLQDFTAEEVGKLQKELTKLLSKKPNSELEKEIAKLPLDRFLNCPSSLEVDRRISHNTDTDDLLLDENISTTHKDDEEDIDKTISIILGRCKDIYGDKNSDSNKNKNNNNNKSIGKKSISFLLKKMFVCTSGFAPQPSLRDTLQESRMEKLLRTMLHKKMHANTTSRSSSMKKFIEDKSSNPRNKNNNTNTEDDERKVKITDDGCKWVKTDSEYIVLEI